MQQLPQQLVNGITLGYTMVYGIIQLINFAHGEVYMIGAFTGLVMVSVYHVNFFVAILAAVAVCVPLAVFLIERLAYRPLRKSTRLAPLISAIGVSIFLQALATLIMGPNPKAFPQIIEDKVYVLGPVQFSTVQIIILVVAILLMLLHLMVKYTRMGRPCGQPPRTTRSPA